MLLQISETITNGDQPVLVPSDDTLTNLFNVFRGWIYPPVIAFIIAGSFAILLYRLLKGEKDFSKLKNETFAPMTEEIVDILFRIFLAYKSGGKTPAQITYLGLKDPMKRRIGRILREIGAADFIVKPGVGNYTELKKMKLDEIERYLEKSKNGEFDAIIKKLM